MYMICSLNAPLYTGAPGGIRTHDPRFRSRNPLLTSTTSNLLTTTLCKPSHIDRLLSLLVRISFAPQYAPQTLIGGVCYVRS